MDLKMGSKERSFDWRSIPLMMFLALTSFGSAISLVVLPLYILDLTSSTLQAGLLSTVASASMMVTSVLSGYLSDKLRRRKPLMMMGAVTLFPLIFLYSYAMDSYHVIILRFFHGFSMMTCSVTASTIITQLSTQETMGKSIGSINMIGALGRSFGNLFGGVVANYFGFGTTFIIGSVFPLISAFVILFLKEPQLQTEETPKSKVFIDEKIQLNFRLLYIFIVMLVCAVGDLFIFMTIYFDSIGFSSEYIGILMWIQSMGHIFFMPFFGSLCDRLGRKKVLIAGTLTLTVAYFTFTLSSHPLVAILGVIGVSLGWSAFRTASQTMIIDYTKITQRGQAIGLSSMMIGIGHMIGSSATGLLSDALQDIALAMRWMSVITFTSFFLSVITRETKARALR